MPRRVATVEVGKMRPDPEPEPVELEAQYDALPLVPPPWFTTVAALALLLILEAIGRAVLKWVVRQLSDD